jgi:O-antigen/teichoic acid export membrane protein
MSADLSDPWYHRRIRKLIRRFRQSAKARATFFYGGSSLVCQALRFVGLLISTRLIPAEQFGLFATAGMIIGFAGLSKEFGQNSAFLSYVQDDKGHASLHLMVGLFGSLIASAIVLTVVLTFSSLVTLRSVVALLVATLILETILQTPQIVANKRFDFQRIAGIEISAVCTWLFVTVLGSLLIPTMLVLVAARFAEAAVRTGLLFASYRHDLSFRQVTVDARRYFWRFAKILGPLGWLQNFAVNLDVALLKAFATDVELGVYDRTQQLMRIPLSLSVNLVDSVAGSSYSREQSLQAQTRKSLVLFMGVMSLGALSGLIGIQLFLLFLAKPILGAQWQVAVGELWVWAIPFAVLRPCVWNFNIMFTSSGRPMHFLLSVGSLTISLLTFGLILAPALHARGVYAAQGIAYFVVFIGLLAWFFRRLQTKHHESAAGD